jgi:hypothetical protein
MHILFYSILYISYYVFSKAVIGGPRSAGAGRREPAGRAAASPRLEYGAP